MQTNSFFSLYIQRVLVTSQTKMPNCESSRTYPTSYWNTSNVKIQCTHLYIIYLHIYLMGVRQARDSKRCCWNVSGILKFIKVTGKLVDLEIPWNSGCIKRKQAFWPWVQCSWCLKHNIDHSAWMYAYTCTPHHTTGYCLGNLH